MQAKAEQKTNHKTKDSVAKSAIYFASGTLMSRLVGMVRDSLLVAIFGQTVSDAWLAAFRFPNLFRRIFGEGALSACFIPLYVEYKDRGNQKALGELTAGVLGLLLAVQIPLTFLFMTGMDKIIAAWMNGKGFTEVPGKMELTITMTKIMFPFLLLMTLYAFFMAVLNAHKKFLLSSMAPLFFNLIIVFASLYCYWTGWISAIFLSWSVIAGGIVQFTVLIPSFYKLQVPFTWSMNSLTSEPVRRVLKAFLPSVFGLGIVQFMSFVNTSFASQLNEGAVTAIYLADRLLELPLSLVAVSLGTALLPTLSEQISQHNEEQFKKELFKNLKFLLLLCIPAAVGLWVTSSLAVSVLFEHGAYTSTEGDVVAGIVRVYAFTLIAASMTRILGQAFYAEKKTMVPAVAALVGFLFHITMAPILMGRTGIQGLVISTGLAAFINCGVLIAWLTVRHGNLYWGALTIFVLKLLAASSAIVAASWLQNLIYVPESFFEKAFALTAVVLVSVLGFFILAKLLKVHEADVLIQKLKRRRRV